MSSAEELDRLDPLARFRDAFHRPVGARGQPLVYLCGHSLGLAPKRALEVVAEELQDWARLGVDGHHAARRPWIDYAEGLRAGLARLTGARADEVVAMNSLSVNLHLLLASFYRPAGQRTRILIERGAFSSDRHVVAAQIAWHGLDPRETLIELAPEPGEDLLDAAAIDRAIAAAGDSLALVLWPGVQYRTGQAFDCGRIARAAHAVGAIAGFDHAHAIGNLPLDLVADDADFAAWCSYKYLNGGPGAVAGAFVHRRHHDDHTRPRLAGWWGHDPVTRFQMQPEFRPAAGAAGWAVSNPPIFSSAPLYASLAQFTEAGPIPLRTKSMQLTARLEVALERRLGDRVRRVTPREPAARGCQLSLRVAGARELQRRLAEREVVADFREPDILRVAPVPLYNGFRDVEYFVDTLVDLLDGSPVTVAPSLSSP